MVPCFNENHRILSVISAIKQSKYFPEIIVVDDGSDTSSKKILSKIKKIILLTHPRNIGKSKAMLSGLLKAKNNIIVFVDADLRNFTPPHLDLLVDTFIKTKVSMLLGDREYEVFYGRLSGFSLAFTGERVFWRHQLIKLKSLFFFDNYLIEPSLNRYYFHHRKVSSVFLSQLGQTEKITKQGIYGFIKDIKMLFDIIHFLGLQEFLFQLNFAGNLRRHQFRQNH
ncbi:MAG: glycosyltransferase [Patescibacteria group bacterium]